MYYNNNILPAEENDRTNTHLRYGLEVDPTLMDKDFYEKVNTAIPQSQSEIINSSINKSIEDGASYVFYCGHGGVNNLGSANYTVCHVDALNNGDLLPIVFAPTCYAGRYNFTPAEIKSAGSFYDTPGYNRCFATEMLKKKNGGCIAIFASADALAIDVARNELLEFAAYNCPTYFLNYSSSPLIPPLRLGELIYRRKSQWLVTSSYSSIHLFGDASMRMYSELPEVINNVSASITSNGGVSLLNITSGNGSEYILWNTETNDVIKFQNEIKSYPIPTFDFNPNDYKVCITGKNKLPYITKLSDIIGSSSYNGSITQVIKRMNTLYVYHNVSQSNNTMLIKSIDVYVYDNQGNFIGVQKASNDKYVSIPIGNRPTSTYVVILKVNGNTVDTKQVIA